MKVLYDISVLGMGFKDARARTGVFRVTENLSTNLAVSKEVDLNFCASFSLKSVNQCIDYLQSNSDFYEDFI